MIKVVLIDIDNTLLDFNASAKQAMFKAADNFSIPFPDEIFPLYKRVNSVLWQRLEKGELKMEDIFEVRWDIIFKEAGIDFDGKLFETAYRRQLNETAIRIDGAYELLNHLYRKYTVCAASNGSHSQQVNRLKIAGLLNFFKAVYTSDILGSQKPTKAFYTECVKRASCVLPYDKQPVWGGETVMIGDSLTADINGIRKFGIEPIWFNFENIDAKPEYKDCKTVNNLKEIIDIL